MLVHGANGYLLQTVVGRLSLSHSELDSPLSKYSINNILKEVIIDRCRQFYSAIGHLCHLIIFNIIKNYQ